MQSHLISRRSLIRSSLIGLACSAAPAISAAEKDDWTETYDVVIIGSGFAGLAAAYSALENGVKSVLVLEKMNVFGGNSCINGGQISLAGSGLQKSKGIKDSPKLMEEDMLRVGQRLNHPALVKAVVKESPACYDMMVKCGVKFADQVIRLGGHSAPRTIFAENYSGGSICVPMHKWLKATALNSEIRVSAVQFSRIRTALSAASKSKVNMISTRRHIRTPTKCRQ